jgi:Domain of unknown function (DUF4157)
MTRSSPILKNSVHSKGHGSVNKPGSFFKPVIQPKLTINQPNDIYEQEADAMADKVMRMPDPSINDNLFFKRSVSAIQRKCAHCEEEEKKIQRMFTDSESEVEVPQIQRNCGPCADEEIHRMMSEEEEEEEESVQRKTADTNEIDPNLESRLSNLGGGQPLSASARSFFEPRFGQSFSDVRVHTGSDANRAAKSINARAYTLGNNIAFASGEYDSSSASGRSLIAHELTHTLQQSAGAKSLQRGSAGIFGGKCCLRAPRVEWALVGAGVWKKLEQGQCTGTMEDADGMTCGGGFYRVDNGQTGTCSTPRNDDATFAPRRWTPSSAGASATSPTVEGSTGGDAPPNYVYDSAATAACPNGVRTISVDLIKLDGSTVSPAAQLATANTVYSGCCVQFVAGATPPQESLATTQGWLGGDTDLQWDDTSNVTAEEKAMFDGATSNRGLSSRMRFFFVASLTPDTARAYSIPPFRAVGGQAAYVNHGVVSNSALTDTVAHELGHILIDSGAHAGIVNPGDTRNLMFAPGRTASDLDATQCATIFGNA